MRYSEREQVRTVSPATKLRSRSPHDQARDALRRVRLEGADLYGEVYEMEDVVRRERESPVKGWKSLREPWIRPAAIAALGIDAFTGIEMMICHAPALLGYSHRSASLSSLGLGIVYALMATAGLILVERVGRRKLTLFLLPCAALGLLALGAVLVFKVAD